MHSWIFKKELLLTFLCHNKKEKHKTSVNKSAFVIIGFVVLFLSPVQRHLGRSCEDVVPLTDYTSGLYNVDIHGDGTNTTVICEVMRDNSSE